MDPFPEEWHLLSFFETEPVLTDAGIPWAYNCLTFDTDRGEDSIHCVIEPGNETLKIIWQRNSIDVVNLDLHWVRGLTIDTGNGVERLTAQFRYNHLLPLHFQLKPTLSVHWGTHHDLP